MGSIWCSNRNCVSLNVCHKYWRIIYTLSNRNIIFCFIFFLRNSSMASSSSDCSRTSIGHSIWFCILILRFMLYCYQYYYWYYYRLCWIFLYVYLLSSTTIHSLYYIVGNGSHVKGKQDKYIRMEKKG